VNWSEAVMAGRFGEVLLLIKVSDGSIGTQGKCANQPVQVPILARAQQEARLAAQQDQILPATEH